MAPLQSAFYIVAIITMSLMTIFLLALVIAVFYVRAKIGDISNDLRDVLRETKSILRHPQKMASTVGEAVVDTAMHQVEKITKPKSSSRRRT